MNFTKADKIDVLKWIWKHQKTCRIRGSYFEFGVLNGRSIKAVWELFGTRLYNYIGFDSFQGLPELTGVDAKNEYLQPQFQKGKFHSQEYTEIKQRFLDMGIPKKNLHLIKGFFEDTLPVSTLNTKFKAAIVHIDVDLYNSGKQALDWIYPTLQTGTWLLCDDYWCYAGSSQAGIQKALGEFLKEHPDIVLRDYCNYRGWSKAFIVEKL